ncbi:protein of unknown function [Granulicatella balaenopterae]|uniref:GRAM domain-containing protein n=1 Tax=Granulicatella balaenopterae TaxID=137733 RepID=A0A1H9LRC4_9LACT|nr:DUF956 family protein [Granulicatella balaenopterae]SER14062.1 protein of unknown function [Granulicatella balaenopterae]
MRINTIIYHREKANYFRTVYTAVNGVLELGNKAIEFYGSDMKFFIQIPFQSIEKIEPQLVFGRFYRGIVITADGIRYHFVVGKAKLFYQELINLWKDQSSL